MSAIRVVVADDDELMRSALVDVLTADPRFEVVGSATNADDLLKAAEESQPAVALVDVRMPGGGVAAATALTALPRPPVVVAVSASSELATIVAMLRAGASGFLGKGRLGESLPDLVARCAAGEVVLAVPNALGVIRALGASTG